MRPIINHLIHILRLVIWDKTSIFRLILLISLILLLSVDNVLAEKQPGFVAPAPNVAIDPKPTKKDFKRISENGGEVLVDGTLRVLEPIYGKTLDLVEVSSTPVTPIANHVRLYAVGVGTYTVIRALFDDGTSKVLINN